NMKRVLRRSRTRADAAWAALATCQAEAALSRIPENALNDSAPVAHLPAVLRNERRSIAGLRSMIGAPYLAPRFSHALPDVDGDRTRPDAVIARSYLGAYFVNTKSFAFTRV